MPPNNIKEAQQSVSVDARRTGKSAVLLCQPLSHGVTLQKLNLYADFGRIGYHYIGKEVLYLCKAYNLLRMIKVKK